MDTFTDTILIVDDNKNNLKVLEELLKPQGYNIRFATHGKGALASVEAQAPALILLDIKLPDIDGYQVCQQLKDNPQTKDIPIIFLSALEDTNDKVRGFNLGAVDYITKPFQSAELLARVRTHLTLQRLQHELQLINDSLEQRVLQRTEELERTCDRLSAEIDRRMTQERQYLWHGQDRRNNKTDERYQRTSEYANTIYHICIELLAGELPQNQRDKLEQIKTIIIQSVEENLIDLPEFSS